jgi:hypothetical protein
MPGVAVRGRTFSRLAGWTGAGLGVKGKPLNRNDRKLPVGDRGRPLPGMEEKTDMLEKKKQLQLRRRRGECQSWSAWKRRREA